MIITVMVSNFDHLVYVDRNLSIALARRSFGKKEIK